MTDKAIEQEIKANGLTAPRVTPADIEANVSGEHYFTAEDGFIGVRMVETSAEMTPQEAVDSMPMVPRPLCLLTFCVLVLRNGFTVTGESACASPENFNREIGRKIARQNAVAKIWPLMGYQLRCNLAAAKLVDSEGGEA